jgi:hypothetical protein
MVGYVTPLFGVAPYPRPILKCCGLKSYAIVTGVKIQLMLLEPHA